MNRYYIDTNILIFIAMDRDSIHRDVMKIIDKYDTQLYTSTVCVQELIHLYQIGKLSYKKFKTAKDIFSHIAEAGIKIIPITERHLMAYAGLPLHDNHNDPNDRLIIAQAISDKITLISSDTKFKLYQEQGLKFVFNRR